MFPFDRFRPTRRDLALPMQSPRKAARRGRPAMLEGLEGRALLAATFTNGGGDREWDNPSNWLDGVVPASGEDIEIPAFMGGSTSLHVATPVTVGNLAISYGDLGITGATITLNGNLFSSGFANGADNLRLTHDTTAILYNGSIFNFGAIDDGGGNYGLTVLGGNHRMNGPGTYGGLTTLDGGEGTVYGTHVSTFDLENGETLYSGNGTVGAFAANGSTLALDDRDGGATTLTVSATFSLDGTSTLRVPVAAFDGVEYAGQVIVVGGVVNLNGATLDLNVSGDFAPSAGHDITLIDNHPGDPVTGTFAGLPEGAHVTVNGVALQMSYVGGTGGHDVVLHVVAPPVPTITSATASVQSTSVRPALSVLGSDPTTGGGSSLTYTWSLASGPVGVRAPRFTENGNNAARNASPRFYAAGTYNLICTVTGSTGLTTTQAVQVTIKQKAVGLRMTPHESQLAVGQTVQYRGYVYDQFGERMRWSAASLFAIDEGGGSITGGGLYTATRRGHAVIRLTIRTFSGVSGATIS